MPEFVYNTFPYQYLIRNIQAVGINDFTVYFFPHEYTRLIQYIKTGNRLKKLIDEMIDGGDDDV